MTARRDTDPIVFMSHVDASSVDGCWPWMGRATRDGYGRWKNKDRHWAAHRLSHLLFIGPIPDGYEVDHLCFNPICVRPDHLEAVTSDENQRRAAAAGRFLRNPSARKTRPPHGETTAHYNAGCRCDPCVSFVREYKRNHRARPDQRVNDAARYKRWRDRRRSSSVDRGRS